MDPSCPWRHYKISQEEYDHIMCTFLTFDTDGSGAMDKDELKTVCPPEAPLLIVKVLNVIRSSGIIMRHISCIIQGAIASERG